MAAALIDGYLLDSRPAKDAVVARLLEDAPELADAAPYYRALAAVGARAADETFAALRLVLAGAVPGDADVRRLRALAALARAAGQGRAADVRAIFARDGEALADMRAFEGDLSALARGARDAYRRATG